jgi:hypothetical protein
MALAIGLAALGLLLEGWHGAAYAQNVVRHQDAPRFSSGRMTSAK